MASRTVEDYIKRIYLAQQESPRRLVAMGTLAAAVGVTPGTATTMVKALADAGLIGYQPRGGVRLTPKGERLALHVLRRHRIIELFLVQVLGVDWSEVHSEAEELEHALSDGLLERMAAHLGDPTLDPHGDPIPSAQLLVADRALARLSDLEAGRSGRVARVLDQDPRFLQFVEKRGLKPGTRLTVQARDDDAQTVALRLAGGRVVTLGRAAAAKILAIPD